jgi:hypothetical protein
MLNVDLQRTAAAIAETDFGKRDELLEGYGPGDEGVV